MTGEKVFSIAVSLLGEHDNGESANYDLEGFRTAAPEMINVLSAQLEELDCILKKVKPDADEFCVNPIEKLSDRVGLHRLICRWALPLGLCYMLLLEENVSRAAYFKKEYERACESLKKRFNRPERHQIRNVYGDI